MNRAGQQSGFSLIELLVSLTLLLVILVGLTRMMVDNSKLNKSQQMTVAAQSNARNCLAMIVAKLRGAGWDPKNAGLGMVNLDPFS